VEAEATIKKHVARTRSARRRRGVLEQVRAHLPQSDVVHLDVGAAAVDVPPLVERDAAPLVRTDRYQPNHRRNACGHQSGDHHPSL